MSRPSAFQECPLLSILCRWEGVVDLWGLEACEREALLGDFAGGAVADPATYAPGRAEERMRLLVELAQALTLVHDDPDRTRFWLRAPNRHLGDASPIEVMSTSTAWIRFLAGHVGLAA